jgi:hypothetical protein
MNNPEILKCKDLFFDSSIQERLLKESPQLMAALHRLYQVAVQVNQFQLEELRTCSNLALGRNMTASE